MVLKTIQHLNFPIAHNAPQFNLHASYTTLFENSVRKHMQCTEQSRRFIRLCNPLKKKNQIFVKHLKVLLLYSSPQLVLGNYILKIQSKYESKILSLWNCIIKPSTVPWKEIPEARTEREEIGYGRNGVHKKKSQFRDSIPWTGSLNKILSS